MPSIRFTPSLKAFSRRNRGICQLNTPKAGMIGITSYLILVLMPLLTAVYAQGKDVSTTDSQPNFLIVVADDLGWSDIGAYGGEIRTDSLNALARQGLLMSQFYVAPTCSPTRSMLLTGIDHHRAGVGTMHDMRAPNQMDSIDYVGQLHDEVVTVAEVLQRRGYQTFMAGKWHLAVTPEQRPHRRGFNRSFALMQGGASHFGDSLPLYEGNPVDYFEDGKPASLAEDFYSSIAYTDKILEYLQSRKDNIPFFAYLAYTAPHDPLQVPDEWLDRYKGAYAAGPVAIREQRAQRIREKGLFPKGAKLWTPPNFPAWLPLHRVAWQERSQVQREIDARPMEIYAAMVELMDQQIGRVIDYLERTGELENTYVIFISDNGANGATPLMYPARNRDWLFNDRDNSPQNAGKPGSHIHLGMEWASVSSSPWKMFKGTVAEGGIRASLIVSGPTIPANQISNGIGHVTDITPTIYALADIQETELHAVYANKRFPEGKSLKSQWEGDLAQSGKIIKTELFGDRAIRKGRWKAHYLTSGAGSASWELYDLLTDPGETYNIAAKHPQILAELTQIYRDYWTENGVIHPEPALEFSLRHLYTGECDWWCELKLDVAEATFTISTRISSFFSSGD